MISNRKPKFKIGDKVVASKVVVYHGEVIEVNNVGRGYIYKIQYRLKDGTKSHIWEDESLVEINTVYHRNSQIEKILSKHK